MKETYNKAHNRYYYNGLPRSHVVWDEYNPDNKWEPGYDIHHIDGDTANDDITNLQKLKSSYHMSIHHRGENNVNYGKKLLDSTKLKMSLAHKGKKLSEEQKRKISSSNKGRVSPNKGIPMSENQKKKISETLKGSRSPWFGKHLSEETKKKMSDSHRKRTERKNCALL